MVSLFLAPAEKPKAIPVLRFIKEMSEIMTKKSEGTSAALRNVPFLISHADSRPDAKAVQAVTNAITALNPQNGIAFGPLTLKCVSGAFWNIWNSQRGDTPIT